MENLKLLREARNLSQYQLAELLHISQRRISSYETGSIEPDIQTLTELADFFNVEIDYLVGRKKGISCRPAGVPLQLSKFGERIREFRLAGSLTPQEVAEQADITPQYLLVVETGAKVPSLETSLKILNALGASADAAFTDSLIAGYRIRASFLENRLNHLAPEDQCLALDILETTIKTLEEQWDNRNRESRNAND